MEQAQRWQKASTFSTTCFLSCVVIPIWNFSETNSRQDKWNLEVQKMLGIEGNFCKHEVRFNIPPTNLCLNLFFQENDSTGKSYTERTIFLSRIQWFTHKNKDKNQSKRRTYRTALEKRKGKFKTNLQS